MARSRVELFEQIRRVGGPPAQLGATVQAADTGRLRGRADAPELGGLLAYMPCPATMTWPGMGDFRLG
jgi:hypothetical protein